MYDVLRETWLAVPSWQPNTKKVKASCVPEQHIGLVSGTITGELSVLKPRPSQKDGELYPPDDGLGLV